MDIRIHEIQSQVRTASSQSALDPAVLREIVRICVQEVKADLARSARSAADRKLSSGDSRND